jgi:tetratricopeptide (TPR) repeat protein
VAALIGVPSDEVFRRAERERKRQARNRNAVIALVIALFGSGGFLAWRSYNQQQTLTDIQAIVNELAPIGSAQAQQGQRESLLAAIKSIAQGAARDPREAQAYRLLKEGKPQEAEPLLRAVAEDKKARIATDRKESAEAFRNLGAIAGLADPKRAREYYAEAVALNPQDLEALYWLGWLNLLAGNLPGAAQALEALEKQSFLLGDERAQYRADLQLGELDIARGNLGSAMDREKRAFAMADRRAKNAPSDNEAQRDLSVAYEKLGDVLVWQGNLAGALASYKEGLSTANRLATSDPDNPEWQRVLGASYDRVGGVLVDQGDLSGALASYKDSFAIRDRLAKADPRNTEWQRGLSVAWSKVGLVLEAQGDLTGALACYKDALAIADRLAKADPGNRGRQRDLSFAYNNVGDVFVAQGDLASALAYHKDALAIAERLAKADPGHAEWQHDLSVAYEKVGDVFKSQGDLAGALANYKDALTTAERLAKADPGSERGQSQNAGWQYDLAMAYWRLAENHDNPKENWTKVVAILKSLDAGGRLALPNKTRLEQAEASLAEAEGAPTK